MKSIFAVIPFLLCCRTSAAQQPLNFSFEKTSVEGTARPWSWSQWQLAPGATISFSNHKVVQVEGMTAPRGSFDEALHQLAKQSGTGQLFLNLRPALTLKNKDWLTQPRPVRFVGYATNDYDFGAQMSVPYQFDGVLFVDETKASGMLR